MQEYSLLNRLMSKRKLTRRQAWRINKIQQEKVQRAQKKDSDINAQLGANELGDEAEGRIVAHFGVQAEVESIQQPDKRYRCFLRANLGALVIGDRVIFRPGPKVKEAYHGIIEAVLPRKSALSRPNAYNEVKAVAANIDFIVLVVAPEPEAHASLIDRYLVAAESSGIEVIILLNKADLLNDDNRAKFDALLQVYEKLGYATLKVSSLNDDSLSNLKALLNQRTSVFVGQSGVGKSSLINTLLPDEELKVGELSEASRIGRHTTTTARLYHFPSGGDLIDSPGIREFGLWHMEAEDVLKGFIELRNLSGFCRFRNCSHEHEPGCAMIAAVENGEVAPQRLASFQQIVRSLPTLEY